MESDELESRWSPKWTELGGAMADWRREHPRATLTEIEEALDERLATMRAEMVADMAVASRAASFSGAQGPDRPSCPECGHGLVSRGEGERRLLTKGGREIRLRRSYGHCPGCGLELFPPR